MVVDMDKQAAKQIIEETFQQPYDKERFRYFIKNLLNHFDEDTFVNSGKYIPDAYRDYIKKLERIGKYEDAEGNAIDVLVVHLLKETSLEYARTMQRNFVARYLNGSRGGQLKDAALVAFVPPGQENWRFSLVRMEYRLVESPNGKVKAKEEFTPARRFSFLVGKNENSHTAQSRLLPLLQDDAHDPTLQGLEDAFSIEKVTKEFFEKYRNLFLDLKETLDKTIAENEKIRQDFDTKNISTVDFGKKLLGQIVFLYFLQKKGWFGVARDNDWGQGPKNFLRQLFDKQIIDYQNFFNDILEPLFYEALAREREENYYSHFRCKIPFLNGGLFDPINNYDWVYTDILIPNEIFSNNEKTKEGDTGTGILDIFDRYNFTVREDEPLEKEVAVDPEMLGRVFENLLEVKDRKSKGTYYTPREIVHYMCQESLINYLITELDGKVSREDIETLIHYGESAVEHDSRVERVGKETPTYEYKLPKTVRNNAALIDAKLADIKVCDPAIGSGAFPVGMMNEIVRTRNALTNYLPNKESRSVYDFKREAIQNSLYGVDIDPGAVEIAKLRLWLSLVVDEEDIKQIRPLPNLDYKIMQGNSLLEEFEGIQLFDEKLFKAASKDSEERVTEVKKKLGELQKTYFELHSANKLSPAKRQELDVELKRNNSLLKRLLAPVKIESQQNVSLFGKQDEARLKFAELKRLHKEFFEAAVKSKKDELRKRISDLEWEFIQSSLAEQGKTTALKKLEKLRQENAKPFFLWKLHFSEIFQSEGGFDVVIANPPYVRHEKIKDIKSSLQNKYRVYKGTADIFCYFYELGFNVLKKQGVLTYITSNKYLRSEYGQPLRMFLKEQTTMKMLIDFGDLPVFEATAYPSILISLKKKDSRNKFKACKIESENELEIFENILGERSIIVLQQELPDEGVWSFESQEITALRKKIENYNKVKTLHEYIGGKIYRGILTGFNEAFVINDDLRQELINQDISSASIIKPFVRGKDVKRYILTRPTKYLIFTRRGVQLDDYPAIKKHLLAYKDDLTPKKSSDDKRGRKPGSYQWYEIQDNIAYWQEFERPKIIYPNIFKKPEFAMDFDSVYANQKCYIISVNNKYLLGFLNSRINYFLIKTKLPKLRGGFYEPNSAAFSKFPIPVPTEENKKYIEQLVSKIFAAKKENRSSHEFEEKMISISMGFMD